MGENLAYAGKNPMRVPCCCYLKGNPRQGVTDGAMVPRRLEKPHACGRGYWTLTVMSTLGGKASRMRAGRG